MRGQNVDQLLNLRQNRRRNIDYIRDDFGYNPNAMT